MSQIVSSLAEPMPSSHESVVVVQLRVSFREDEDDEVEISPKEGKRCPREDSLLSIGASLLLKKQRDASFSWPVELTQHSANSWLWGLSGMRKKASSSSSSTASAVVVSTPKLDIIAVRALLASGVEFFTKGVLVQSGIWETGL